MCIHGNSDLHSSKLKCRPLRLPRMPNMKQHGRDISAAKGHISASVEPV